MTDQPEPTARQRLIRTGLSHAFADLVLNQHAHQLAEEQRSAARVAADAEHPKLDRRAPVGILVAEGIYQGADLIDPEAKP